MRPIVVERGVIADEPSKLWWRWCCSRCGQQGAWLLSLNDAERGGAAHNKTHEEQAAQA